MGPPLNPDADTARRWLETELSNGDYTVRQSWLSQFLEWLDDLLKKISSGASSAWQETSWWALLVGVLLVVVVVWLVRRARRTPLPERTSEQAPTGDGAVPVATAEELRAVAARARSEGRHDEAVIASVRALMRSSDAAGLLRLRDGLTVQEAAAMITAARPELAAELQQMAYLFALARYGRHATDQLCTAEDADRVADLERRVGAPEPETVAAPAGPVVGPTR